MKYDPREDPVLAKLVEIAENKPVWVPGSVFPVEKYTPEEQLEAAQKIMGFESDRRRLLIEEQDAQTRLDHADIEMQIKIEAAKTERIKALAQLVGAAAEIPEVKDRVVAQLEQLAEVAAVPKMLSVKD